MLLPYNVVKEQDDYYFVTENEIKYIISLLTSHNFFIEYPEIHKHVFVFNIFPEYVSAESIPIDVKTGLTIAEFIKKILTDNRNCLIYICDSNDKRGDIRKNKFNRWFNSYNNGSFDKIDESFDMEDEDGIKYKTHSSLIISIANPDKNFIINEFKKQAEELKK